MPNRRWVLYAVPVVAVVIGSSVFLWQRIAERRQARETQTVVEAIRKVARLTSVEMDVSSFQLKKDTKNLLGFIPIKCEKTIAIAYRGKVAAGFDLDEGTMFTVTATPGTRGRAGKLVIELPAPRLLSVDAPVPEIVVADGSLCNRLEPSDYQALAVEGRAAVEREAIASGILAKAETHARELVRAVAAPLGYEADIRLHVSALSEAR